MEQSFHIKKVFNGLLVAGLVLWPLAGRAASPMQTPPTIYQLPQQTADTVVEGSYPGTLQIGNFDTSGASTDAIGNDFNEISLVGTTDTFVPFAADTDGYANIWSVIHNGPADPASLSVVNPISLVVPFAGPGFSYPQAANLLDLQGDGADDLNFLGGKTLGLCPVPYGDACSVLSVSNVTPSTAPFFDPGSLTSLADTTGQLFGIPAGPAFIQELLQVVPVIGGLPGGIISGNPLQDKGDYGNDGDEDIFYYDYTPGVGPFVPGTAPNIITLESDGAGGVISLSNAITLPDSLLPEFFRSINAGDFNGDGQVDLALLFTGTTISQIVAELLGPGGTFTFNELLIFYGNADGSFGTGAGPFDPNVVVQLEQSPVDLFFLPPGTDPRADFVHTLANGDFDNNGFQDFVVGSVGIGIDLNIAPPSNIYVSSAPYNHVILCSAGGCSDTPVLASPFLNFIVRNAVADFNSDGVDDIVTATISPNLLGIIVNVIPGTADSEVRLYLNQGGGSFAEPENADQVFQVPVANVIDPDTGISVGGHSYGISDMVAGNIDNCGGPDLAFASFVCPTDFDPTNPDQNPFQVCFPGIIPFILPAPNPNATKAININDSDTTTPGAVSVVLNEVIAPVLTPISVDVASSSSIGLSTTCTTDGNEASQITWTLDTPVAGASIQNANSANATLVFSGAAAGNVTVSVSCADACNSTSLSTSFNALNVLAQGSGCSLGLGGSPADYSILAFVVLGLMGRRLLKR